LRLSQLFSKIVAMSNSPRVLDSQAIAPENEHNDSASAAPLAQQLPEGQRPKRLMLKVSKREIASANVLQRSTRAVSPLLIVTRRALP
jgi:hypothetical protein